MGGGEESEPVEVAVREALRHTWHAFFGRFGRLTAIQAQAVLPIFGGASVMVVAPTASGKTEAVVAPLLDRIYEGGRGHLSMLLISPTRALSNDLRRRLEMPVTGCGLKIDVKTGDSAGFNDEEPPELLVTTPESLDSMLCRRPGSLRQVRAVMIDELHLLGFSPRGDQLRCLLARLSKVSSEPLQICAASATLPEAEALARRYLGEGAQVITAGEGPSGQREIEAELVEAVDLDEAAEAIAALFGEAPRRKLIVFANTRSQVEALTAALGQREQLRGRVFAHHGSLARGERLRVERSFQDAPTAICVATLTLEIGVDIGGVDRVVLLSPPPGVSSLLQRVGRSNRREAITRVLCLYNGDFERARFEHLLDCAARGELFEDPIPFRPSVLAQQSLSLLFQNPARWVTAEALHPRLPPDAAALWSQADCAKILEKMQRLEYLREGPYKRHLPDEKAARAFEVGRMHANIQDSPDVEVVDELTGRALGRVRLRAGDRARIGAEGFSLALGGRGRQVARVHGDRLVVRGDPGGDGVGRFIGREAPRYSFALAQSLARWVGISPGTLVIERPAEGDWRLVHFWGTVWGRLLEATLRVGRGRQISGRSEPFISPLLPGLLPAEGVGIGPADKVRGWAEVALASDLVAFARLLEPGPMMECVPPDMLRRWVTQAIDLERFVALASSVEVVRGDPSVPLPTPDDERAADDPGGAPVRWSASGEYIYVPWHALALRPGERWAAG